MAIGITSFLIGAGSAPDTCKKIGFKRTRPFVPGAQAAAGRHAQRVKGRIPCVVCVRLRRTGTVKPEIKGMRNPFARLGRTPAEGTHREHSDHV